MNWTAIQQARLVAVEALLRDKQHIFAAQGAVVASWRTARGRTFGPYFRLAYRADGVQRSLYLGRSQALVDRVTQTLVQQHAPRRQRTLLARWKRQARAGLRRAKQTLDSVMAQCRVQMKGYEFRGVSGTRFDLRRRSPCGGLAQFAPEYETAPTSAGHGMELASRNSRDLLTNSGSVMHAATELPTPDARPWPWHGREAVAQHRVGWHTNAFTPKT